MRSRYSINNDPRVITAKFTCKCAETGTMILKGKECLFYPSTKSVYSIDSKQASDYRAWHADLSMGFDY